VPIGYFCDTGDRVMGGVGSEHFSVLEKFLPDFFADKKFVPDRATRQFFKNLRSWPKIHDCKKNMCQLYIRGADNYPCRGRVTDTFFFSQKKFTLFF